MLTALLVRAAAEPGVRTVRATIRSDNNASLATIAGFGFTRVGEQGDERDGLEIVFEVPADAIQAEQLYGLGGHGDRPGRAVT
ncbi:GNAT family protein [Streptomyces sp. NPDC002205]|uniref:GNAT family protein n=1 Tax=unclassified Streptomyces TaxID=2593676 RepID=UPI0033314286